jgi:biopolymer transport protein ExbB
MTNALRRLLPVLALAALLLLPAALAAQEADAGASPPDVKVMDNIFIHVIKSVGIFWAILLPTSIWLIALIVLLTLDLRMSAAIPPGFVDEFTDTVNKRKFKEAYDLARGDSSYLGRVLTAGMARLQYGIEDAREASMNTLEVVKSDKEQKNNYTAVIATLGPLLGLVGTVFGMIMAFMELSTGSNPNPAKLADGISHALAVTLVGVGIAVPAIAFNTYFRNRILQVMLEVGSVSDDLLTQMYHNSKKPATAAAAPVAATPVTAAPAAAVPR